MFEGSIPALVTPMGEDGSIDFGAWEKLLDFHLAAGTDGVVVGGTTGESPVLERGEIEELIRRAKSRVGGRIPVIAGSGTNSTAGVRRAVASRRGCGRRRAAGRHALLQQADPGRPVPAFQRRGGRGRHSGDPLQRARTDRLRHAGGHGGATVAAPSDVGVKEATETSRAAWRSCASRAPGSCY